MTKGKNIGYIRVSTVDQNPERQLEGIPIDKKFTEYASGTTRKRPELEKLMSYAREDDTIIVHSMDRLARNLRDLIKIIEELNAIGVKVHFIKENLIFTGNDSPMSKLVLMLLGAIAEFEHSIIMERIMQGVRIAHKKGKYKGRTKCMDSAKMEILKKELTTRKSKSRIARDLGISRFSLYRYMKELPAEPLIEVKGE